MKLCSLREAGEVIFSKLYNMTTEKQLRYRTVYTKLQDFEQMLVSSGVPTQIDVNALTPVTRTDASLLSPVQALRELRTMTLRGSVALMRTISTDKSLEQLLEQAKGEISELMSAAAEKLVLSSTSDAYDKFLDTAEERKDNG